MKTEVINKNVSVLSDQVCSECKWPVLICCVNDNFADHYKEAWMWDWWVYCTNKGCNNHKGEGYFQQDPTWIELKN